MAQPHSIRLRGPWEWEILSGAVLPETTGAPTLTRRASEGDGPDGAGSELSLARRASVELGQQQPLGSTSSGRWQLPLVEAPIELVERAVPLRLTRHFNWTARLAAEETVSLIFESLGGVTAIWLNDQPLTGAVLPAGAVPTDVTRFDVTRLLVSRNTLVVDLQSAAAKMPQSETRLEIASNPGLDFA